jgi:hypothetical protein
LVSRKWLAVPAGVAFAVLYMTRQAYAQSSLWLYSYDRLYMTVPLVAAAGAIPTILLRRAFVLPALLLVAIGWWRFGAPIVFARTTDHLEYRWLREQLAQLPPECRVIHLASAGKRGLYLPTYVGTRSRSAVPIIEREPHTLEEALSPADCLYYVHTSLCSSTEGRPTCAAIEGRLTLLPLARAVFPPRPSSDGLPYDRDPVETVIARVQAVQGVTK